MGSGRCQRLFQSVMQSREIRTDASVEVAGLKGVHGYVPLVPPKEGGDTVQCHRPAPPTCHSMCGMTQLCK